ncbi:MULTISPECIES: hypothetical protein [unclassified Streptomyces]|nr:MULTISPECIES: hypothetical protein [unclassified Streptomyces]MCX5053723.1 hypothetical protein [Streptomyces sp. NBC_00474]MCX5058771.1 hypothetical protein [Streptomyces sp. NBC_00452]
MPVPQEVGAAAGARPGRLSVFVDPLGVERDANGPATQVAYPPGGKHAV